MKKMITIVSLFLSHTLYTSAPSVNTAPPLLPSSSVIFEKLASPAPTIGNPQNLPCFQAYDELYRLVYPNQNGSNVQLVIAQGSNQAFINAQKALTENAQKNSSAFNN